MIGYLLVILKCNFYFLQIIVRYLHLENQAPFVIIRRKDILNKSVRSQ